MSQYKVKTVHHPLNCTLKYRGLDITNRALLMAALSDGECTLHGVLSAMIQTFLTVNCLICH